MPAVHLEPRAAATFLRRDVPQALPAALRAIAPPPRTHVYRNEPMARATAAAARAMDALAAGGGGDDAVGEGALRLVADRVRDGMGARDDAGAWNEARSVVAEELGVAAYNAAIDAGASVAAAERREQRERARVARAAASCRPAGYAPDACGDAWVVRGATFDATVVAPHDVALVLQALVDAHEFATLPQFERYLRLLRAADERRAARQPRRTLAEQNRALLVRVMALERRLHKAKRARASRK